MLIVNVLKSFLFLKHRKRKFIILGGPLSINRFFRQNGLNYVSYVAIPMKDGTSRV
jgi:hypothetical protein